jgi:hypothetical protein
VGVLAQLSAGALPKYLTEMSWHSAVGRPDAILVRGPETGPTARATVPLMERRYGHDYDSIVDRHFCGRPPRSLRKPEDKEYSHARSEQWGSCINLSPDERTTPTRDRNFRIPKKNGANAAPFPRIVTKKMHHGATEKKGDHGERSCAHPRATHFFSVLSVLSVAPW